MACICPTVTAFDTSQYKTQMDLLETFAERIHIDLMDGEFAPTISPAPKEIWWPKKLTTDIHLMYERPMEYIEQLVELKPNLVIIHFEADVDHAAFARRLQEAGIRAGVALLQDTTVGSAAPILQHFDHVMIFSGNLGHHGGSTADPRLLHKAQAVRQLQPGVETGWDGGVNADNALVLATGGIDVLNVGGFVHKAASPKDAYTHLCHLVASNK